MRSDKILGGRYRLGEQLGQGSLGRVLEAQHIALAQQVAVKIILAEVVRTAGGPRRVLARAKAAARVHHRNLVDILDVGQVDDTVYVVTERMPGRTLRDELRQAGRLRWPRARAVALQIVAALKAAHKRDVLHRGLNTSNCFVLEDPAEPEGGPLIKVSDLGLGHPTSSETGLEQERTSPLITNASFAAPELGNGEAPTVQTDLYALGVVLYHILTGELPFEGATPFLVLTAHAERPVPPPRSKVPSIPGAVEAVVLRALTKDPRERFASARELELALTDIPAEAEVDAAADEDEPADDPPTARSPAPQAVRAARAPVVAPPTAAPPVPTAAPPAPAVRTPAPVPTRNEAMHAAFEAQQLDGSEPTPTALFDARAMAPQLREAQRLVAFPRPALPPRTTTEIAAPPPAPVIAPISAAEETVVLDPAAGRAHEPAEETVVLPEPMFRRKTERAAIHTVVAPAPPPAPSIQVTVRARPAAVPPPQVLLHPVPRPRPAGSSSRLPLLIVGASMVIAAVLIGLASTCPAQQASSSGPTTSSLVRPPSLPLRS